VTQAELVAVIELYRNAVDRALGFTKDLDALSDADRLAVQRAHGPSLLVCALSGWGKALEVACIMRRRTRACVDVQPLSPLAGMRKRALR
jgi:hypothetical protein